MALSDAEQQKLQQLVDENKDQMADGELTSRVELALRRKYDFPEWALFFEVPGKNGRQADVIAFNMFPSRNFKTIGFEVKVSRSDWKKELEDISKADYFVGQCDEWYVVTGRKGIVKESELPEGWGLLEMKGGGKLYQIVESNLTEHQNRAPDREFYARGIQKAMKCAKKRKREKRRARREGYREGKKEGKKIGSDELDNETKRLIRKGQQWNELRDHGVRMSFITDDEEKMERFKIAHDLVRWIESDEFLAEDGLPLQPSVEKLRKRMKALLDGLDQVEDALDELQSGFNDIRLEAESSD